MAKKICPVCNETKINIMNTEKIKDGRICQNCEEKLGLKFVSFKNTPILEELTVANAIAMINAGEKFDYAEEKEKRNQQKAAEKQQKLQQNTEKKQQQINEKQQSLEQNTERMNQIKSQIERAGVSDLFGTKKEVKALPEIMAENETLLYATSGFVDTGTVLVVITDQRLIFVDRGMIYGTNFREIPFKKINSVSYSIGLLNADIEIENGASTTKVQSVQKQTAPIFVDILKKIIAKNVSASHNDEIPDTKSTNSTSSFADELFKLKQLLDDGVLTQNEFDKQKTKLLDN